MTRFFSDTDLPVLHSFSGGGSKGGSALVDTRVIYCGDNLEQLKKLPDECVDLIYIDPPCPKGAGEISPKADGQGPVFVFDYAEVNKLPILPPGLAIPHGRERRDHGVI